MNRLEISDILVAPVISDAQIDPAGKFIVYTSAEVLAVDMKWSNKLNGRQLWLVDTEMGAPRQLTHGSRADFHPRWSPDGKRIAFFSDRMEAGVLQIHLMEPSLGDAVQGCEVGGEIDTSGFKEALQWSSDGKFLAFVMKDAESAEEKRRREEKDDVIEFEKVHRYSRLWTLEIATRKLRSVTPRGLQVWEYGWSPDCKEFALVVSDFPYEWSWYKSRLARVKFPGGPIKTIYNPAMMSNGARRQLAFPRWSPDQQQVAFLSSVWSDRGLNSGGLFIVPAKGGEPRHLTSGYPGSIGCFEWTKTGLWACGYEEGNAAFLKIIPSSGRVQTLWRAPVAIHEHFAPRYSITRNQRRVAMVLSSPRDPRNIWIGHIHGSGLNWKRLTDISAHLRRKTLGTQEMISWRSRDGLRIRGILIKPVGYKKNRRYPLVVNPHGGPTSIFANGFLVGVYYWGQLLAANGYAVFLPNFRGSFGFGLEFAEANVGDMGGMDFQDIESGVDALIERGIADPQRLGLGGWSYGGFMTCWAITQTRRYKAAVMGAGISNWESFHGNSHLHSWAANHYGADPHQENRVYSRFSGIRFASKVRTPTLILHGELDRDCPAEQAYQFFRALRDNGATSELVIFPREGHGITEKNHWLDLMRRILAWYRKYLLV